MKVYFVRHGESEENVSKIHSGGSAALTELGKEQADFVGKRLADITFEKGFCSPLTRTKQTAEIINKHNSIQFEYLDELKEISWPSVIHGKGYMDEDAYALKREIDKKRAEDESFKHSDEESFIEIKGRCETLKQLFEAQNEDGNYLAVSHHYFSTVFMAYLLHGTQLTYEKLIHMKFFFLMQNTGITVFEYNKRDWYPWQLYTWNDHAHL